MWHAFQQRPWAIWLVRIALGVLITAATFWLLFTYIDADTLRQLFTKLDGGYLFVGIVLFAGTYLTRALRFRVLVPQAPFSTMLFISCAHNALLRIMPLRTGDLSYAFLLKRSGLSTFGSGIMSLIVVRLIDAAMVLVLFAIALSFSQRLYLGDPRRAIVAALSVAALGFFCTLFLGRLLALALSLFQIMLRACHLETHRFSTVFVRFFEQALQGFRDLPQRTMLRVVLLSLLVWLLQFSLIFAIIRMFSIPMTVAQSVLGGTAGIASGFLPLGGIGSFGTLEAGWTLGFVLVGVERSIAIASGLGYSLITFVYALVFGVIGWIGLVWQRRKQATNPQS